MTASEEWQLNPYLGWQRQQGIPIHTGFFIEDLRKVAVGYWKARNANGAFINLSNAVVNDAVVLEIPRGEKIEKPIQVIWLIDEPGTAQYASTLDPRYAAARLWVDKILAPPETRRALITALEVAAHNPAVEPFRTGVLQV